MTPYLGSHDTSRLISRWIAEVIIQTTNGLNNLYLNSQPPPIHTLSLKTLFHGY